MKNNLRKWREENNLKAKEVAENINISLSYYQSLENGHKRINEDVLNLLFEKYGVSAGYILNHSCEEDLSNYGIVVEYAKGSNISPERLKILIKHHLALMKEFD